MAPKSNAGISKVMMATEKVSLVAIFGMLIFMFDLNYNLRAMGAPAQTASTQV